MRRARQNPQLRILLVEDDPHYIELTTYHLRNHRIACQIVPVCERKEFEAELDRKPDLILSDTNVPRLDGLSALTIASAASPEVPFVILSGTLREATKKFAFAHGAVACVLKEEPEKLVSVIRRLFGIEADDPLVLWECSWTKTVTI